MNQTILSVSAYKINNQRIRENLGHFRVGSPTWPKGFGAKEMSRVISLKRL